MRRSAIPMPCLACAALLLATGPTLAQSSTGLSSAGFGTSGLGSSGFGNSGLSSSGLGGGGLGGSSSFGGSSFGAGGSSGFGGSGFGGSGFGSSGFGTTSTGSTGFGGTTGRGRTTQVGATSFEGPYFINPYALGLAAGTTGTGASTGNFGSPLYTLSATTTGTASINSQNNNMTNGFGVGVNIRRLPAYATTLKFAVPPPPPPAQVRLDLQNMIAQTTQLNPADSVRIVMDGSAVVLRGRVADDDERRLVENMVLLSPGVNQIRNELTVAGTAP